MKVLRPSRLQTTHHRFSMDNFFKAILVSLFCWHASASWGNDNTDNSVFGSSLSRDWLYDSKAISMKLEGCVWGFVSSDNDNGGDTGCMEDGSEDGTTYWYQMANCRRPQAVFSLYASDSSNSASCNSNNFKESFLTTGGLSEFIQYLSQYDANNPFGDNYAGDDGANDDDAADDGNNEGGAQGGYEDLPMCEQGDNGYIGLGCGDDGTFTLQYYNDEYCLQPAGKTYDKLNSLNNALKNYKSCSGIWYNGNDEDDNALVYYLVSASDSCSSLDSGYCTDNSAMKNRRSNTSNILTRNHFSGGHTWVTKLKFATGGLLLLSSFIMFTGILFTNRRRRRALMQRKYRQSRKRGSSRSKSGRSKSKSRGENSRKSSRSRSKPRKSNDAENQDGDGVFA